MANSGREGHVAVEHAPPAQPLAVTPGGAGPAMALQRSLGNRAASRLLARQPKPGTATGAEGTTAAAGAAPPPHPGEQPAHREAFDAFTAAIMGATTVPELTAARAACDGPAFNGEKTISFGGRQLIVDQANATEILTRVRWRALDRVHQMALTRRAEEATAAAAAPGTGDAATIEAAEKAKTAAVEAAKTGLVNDASPYLDFLAGPIQDPVSQQNCYQHWYDVVQASVLLVIQLRAVRAAQGVGLDAAGKGKTRGDLDKEVGRMGTEAWCGAFADYVYRQVGLGSAAGKGQLDGEQGVLAFFGYSDPISTGKQISTAGNKLGVKEYHAQRHSLRRIQVIANRPGPDGNPTPGFSTAGASGVQREDVDIAPGDILLLDNLKGMRPDHIMIATAYDAAAHKVSKIAGNEVDKPGRVNTGTFDLSKQPDAIPPDKHALYQTVADLTNKKDANNPNRPFTAEDEKKLADAKAQIATFESSNPQFFTAPGAKISRIAAVCRFSIVDFEQHDYVPVKK